MRKRVYFVMVALAMMFVVAACESEETDVSDSVIVEEQTDVSDTLIVQEETEEVEVSYEEETSEVSEDVSDVEEEEEQEECLTVENCPELSEMLGNKAEIDESYEAFADRYEGRIIEFDGRIDYCTNHEDYTTRFDYLVSAGDYNPDTQVGPVFKFENVSYYELNTDLDTVSVGLNVHIVAEVDWFDRDTGLFFLTPVSVTGR